ncbi:hypothetical protein BH23GEM2_BH23GEM2_03600 [soil metagenome]
MRCPAVRRTSGVFSFTLLATVACSDSPGSGNPTGPLPPTDSPPAARIAVSSGADQQWFAGEPLPNPVTVVVLTASNGRVTGERVRFTVTVGDGSVQDSIVVSGSAGLATTAWTLGPEAGAHELTVSLASGTVPPVTIPASAVSPAEADYLLVSNVSSPSLLAIFVGYDGWYGYGVVPARVESQSFAVTSGFVRLLPRDASFADEELVAFAGGRPPALVKTNWQPRPDTLVVSFAAPRNVPLTIWLLGDFTTFSDRAQRDLNATSILWSSHPFGLELNEVTINDASQHALTPIGCGSVPVEDPASINV